MQTTYYCGTEDGEHFTEFSEQEHIFDALVDYYDAINDGDEGYLEGIELGIYSINDDGIYDEMETLEFHSFDNELA
jgi:hypothetical protein